MDDHTVHQRVMVALRALSESTEENLLLFSSWLNAIVDLPDDFSTSPFFTKVKEVVQANMEQRMYRIYSEELSPSHEEIRAWLDKI